jgi:hypothetical protein
MAVIQERSRVYRAFARPVDKVPTARKCRDTETPRERIARPYGATPRRAQDWQ